MAVLGRADADAIADRFEELLETRTGTERERLEWIDGGRNVVTGDVAELRRLLGRLVADAVEKESDARDALEARSRRG
jgi:hypothetical protein